MTHLYPTADPAVDAFVRGYCRWHVAPSVDETVVVVGVGSGAVLLPTLMLTDVAAVRVDGVAVSLDSVRWTPHGVLYRDAGFAVGSVVAADITHGFAECPADVREVGERLAAQGRVPAGATVRVGQVSVSGAPVSAAGLDGYASAVLGRYRRSP